MPSPLVRRYLVFLVVITVAVLAIEQAYQLYFLNVTFRAEAEQALRRHPDLARRLGPHRFGFAWRGHDAWWIEGPANALAYLPVTTSTSTPGTGGVLYLREYGEAGHWKLQKLSFREKGSEIWTSY